MGQKMDHAQKETKAMKAQLKMQATRCDAQKSEIDEQTKRQSDTAQLIERVRHRLARSLAPSPPRSPLTARSPPQLKEEHKRIWEDATAFSTT